MARLNRVIFNILCKDLTTSAAFYRQLAGFEQVYTSSWYIMMSVPGRDDIEIGLIDEVSEFAPRHAWGAAHGAYLTLVVDDVFETLERARALGAEIVEEPPQALDYGQTRALIRDPNGLILDISTPTEDLAAQDRDGLLSFPRGPAIDQAQPEDRH